MSATLCCALHIPLDISLYQIIINESVAKLIDQVEIVEILRLVRRANLTQKSICTAVELFSGLVKEYISKKYI